MKNGIDAKHLNECAPKRTSWPFLSQELSAEIGDYLSVDGLINHKNAKFD
jgi:hypothetical protein